MSRIRFIERTGSTNADLIADAETVEGDWLVAGVQDAGRGRQGRNWVSPAGNFSGSTLVRLGPGDPPPQTLSLIAGLGLAEAVDLAVPGERLMLKWPNDLMLNGRKLAGILLERSGDRVVVGFGVNLAIAPQLPDRESASLSGAVEPKAFAPLLAGSFDRMLRLWRTTDSMLLSQAWQARAHPLGTLLTVHSSPGESITGRFDGLEPDGALRVRLDSGALEVVRAGDVGIE